MLRLLFLMKKERLPKSLRKYIRREKARIRREVLDSKERKRLVQELYQKIYKNKQNNEDSRNLQPSNK